MRLYEKRPQIPQTSQLDHMSFRPVDIIWGRDESSQVIPAQIATPQNHEHYIIILNYWSLEWFRFSSVTQSCLTLCDPMNRSTPGLPVHHQLLEFTQTHVHWVGDAIQPSHPLLPPSLPALNLSEHQGLFKWVSSSRYAAKLTDMRCYLYHKGKHWRLP